MVTVASLADSPRHSAAVPNSFLRGFPLLLSGPPVTVRAPLKLAVIYPESHSVYLGLAECSQISSQLSRGTQRYSSHVLHVPSSALQAQAGAGLVSRRGRVLRCVSEHLDDIRCSALALWTCCVLPV